MTQFTTPDKVPRIGPNADSPGAYEPVIKIRRPLIDPRELLEIEVYVTGYGDIGSAKLTFTPPPTFSPRNPSLATV